MRTCCTCHEEKDDSEFPVSNKIINGLPLIIKRCNSCYEILQQNKKIKKTIKGKSIKKIKVSPNEVKKCTKCHSTKAYKDFINERGKVCDYCSSCRKEKKIANALYAKKKNQKTTMPRDGFGFNSELNIKDNTYTLEHFISFVRIEIKKGQDNIAGFHGELKVTSNKTKGKETLILF